MSMLHSTCSDKSDSAYVFAIAGENIKTGQSWEIFESIIFFFTSFEVISFYLFSYTQMKQRFNLGFGGFFMGREIFIVCQEEHVIYCGCIASPPFL